MNNIKVSIIMPIYNVEKYLPKCFDSVLNSTLKDIEIIAVDDGAKDNSGEIIDEYAAKDSRIIPIHKENGGYGSAINAGLEIAKGEYIAILETDDWVAPNMYETLYENAKKYNVDCVKGNFYYCPAENINNLHRFFDSLPINEPFKLKEHTEILLLAPSIWSAIYKHDFLKANNIKCTLKVTPYEDLPFACEAYSKADAIVLIDEPLYYYRCEPKQGSSTIRSDRKLFRIIEQIQNTLEIVEDIGSLNCLREVLFKHIYNTVPLFVGNAHNDLKEELFCAFGDFFNSEFAKDLKYSFFNNKEMQFVKALKSHNYFYYANIVKIKNFIQNIFSVRNQNCHKIITILGVKFKFKSQKLITKNQFEKIK